MLEMEWNLNFLQLFFLVPILTKYMPEHEKTGLTSYANIKSANHPAGPWHCSCRYIVSIPTLILEVPLISTHIYEYTAVFGIC